MLQEKNCGTAGSETEQLLIQSYSADPSVFLPVYLELQHMGCENRFFTAAISTDLFGLFIVDWSRGTIGHGSHSVRSAYVTEDAAVTALGRASHAMLRQGYRPIGRPVRCRQCRPHGHERANDHIGLA